jgi:Tfp pilus assembly PilM family ATPase
MASNHRVVALNIGTSNIIAVQGLVKNAPQGERTAVVEKIATAPTPKGAVRSNGIHMPDVLVEALKELWRTSGLQTKDVVVGVDSRRVQSGAKWIPYYHPEDLAIAATTDWVKQQQILPSSADRSEADVFHYVLRERTVKDAATSQDQRQILLMVVGVPKSEPQAFANVVEDAGLEMVGMDLTALSLMRAARLTARDEDKRVVDMVVDIGDTFTTMLLHNSGNIRAAETVSGSAGESVTRAIAEDLKRMPKESGAHKVEPEQIKRTLGHLVKNNSEDPLTRRAQAAAERQANALMRDLDSFVTKYLEAVNETGGLPGGENNEERGLASVLLTGGGSALHGLAERLAQKEGGFNIPVNHASVSRAFVNVDGSAVRPFENGISIVSTVGLLTADRKAV